MSDTTDESNQKWSKKLSDWTDKRGIAAHLKCSERHITNQMLRRRIPFYRWGRSIRFKVADVEAAMKAFEVKSVGSF